MKNLTFILSASVILFMASCGKKNDATPGGTVPKSVTTYFAGTDGPNAVYWQNGKEHALTVNEQGGLNVFGMAVAGPDVYITGFDGESNAVYWKNGVASVLPIYAQCVAVSGTDVYFAGWRPGTPYPAAFIKDGVYKVLPTFGGRAFPNTAAIAGNDLYFAGSDDDSSIYYTPVYWKNGTEYRLPTLTNPAFASVATMAISGTDVYFAGYDGPSPVYWKNGVEHVLPTAASPIPRATVSGMAISGTDIYFAGFDYQSAVYWKNGVEIKLPSLSNSSTGSSAVGIAIAGNDIYLAGTENSQGKDTTVAGQTFVPTITAPVYWKNSKPFALPLANGGNGTVTTMAVVSY